MKRLLLIVVAMFGMLLVVQAQDATVEPEPEREIYTVLGWGDDVFEQGNWYASAEELLDRTRATWRSDGLGGLAFADYIHFEEGINLRQIDTVFDNTWFETTLGGTYDVWREDVRCDLGDVRLIEFSLQLNTIKYTMRYWIEAVDRNRVMAIFITLPTTDTANMDFYAERLYPDLSSCFSTVG